MTTFAEIAVKYLAELGYKPFECSNEEEARVLVHTLPDKGKWPCFFTKSDTTGEKDFEEFFMDGEILDLNRFENMGIVKSNLDFEDHKLESFLSEIEHMRYNKAWQKSDIVSLFESLIQHFEHKETGKYLDSKM